MRFTLIHIATFLILSNCVALAQNPPPEPDPIHRAMTKAMRDGRFADAEKILVDAIHEAERSEAKSPKLADYLNQLSLVLSQKSQYSDAIALSQRALEVDKNAFGPTDIHVASDLAWIAGLSWEQGNSEAAEQLLKQALDIVRLNPNPNADQAMVDRTVLILGSLWSLYISEQRWVEAEPLLLEGTKLCKSMRMPSPPCDNAPANLKQVYEGEGRAVEADKLPRSTRLPAEVAKLNDAAEQYQSDGAYPQAEDAYNRAIAWVEMNKRPEFPELLSYELNSLGQVLEKQGLNEAAEKAYTRAIEWKESAAGPNPPGSLVIKYFDFNRLLNLYRTEERLSSLEPIIRHALDIQEQFLEPRDPGLASTLVTLADVYQEEGKNDEKKYAEAEPLYRRALDIQQQDLGRDHPQLLAALTGYASLLRKLHEDAKAAEVQSRIDMIEKKVAEQSRRN